MEMLIDYLKENKASSASKVVGPNGAFISVQTKGKAKDFTIPVGKKSQGGKLGEYNVLFTDDGQAIAVLSQYETQETIEF